MTFPDTCGKPWQLNYMPCVILRVDKAGKLGLLLVLPALHLESLLIEVKPFLFSFFFLVVILFLHPFTFGR